MSHALGSWVAQSKTELRLTSEELALATGVDPKRLEDIEQGKVPGSLHELEALSRLIGWDLAGWDPDEEAQPASLPSVKTLFKSSEGILPVSQWSEVTKIAEVAREIVLLERALELPDRMAQLRARWQPDGAISDPAWPDGQRLARLLRESPTTPCGESFPLGIRGVCERLGIVVIESFLPEGIDALCFADSHHGPTIVVDVQPPVLVQRFRIAHEICHVLFDRHALDPLQRFDRFERGRDEKPAVEQRADAFAIYLLAPEDAFRHQWQELATRGSPPESCIQRAISYFGTSLKSTIGHAKSLGLLSWEERASLSRIDPLVPQSIIDLESEETSKQHFAPLRRERRGALLRLTLRAFSQKAISRSRALELLAIDGDTFDERYPGWATSLGLTP